MTNRSNNGRALARRSAAATRQPRSLGDVVAALGLTLDDLYPVWLLRLADGTLVHQRGINAADAARRYAAAHPNAARPTQVANYCERSAKL